MAEEFKISVTDSDELVIFEVEGYFAEEAGSELNRLAEEVLCQKKLNLVVDFQKCSVLSSPGVGKMIELAELVAEDFLGSICLCGLDEIKEKVLRMTGGAFLADIVSDVDSARELLLD